MYFRFSEKRRRILIGLAGVLPVAQLVLPLDVLAAQNDDVFLRVSRVITGSEALSAGAAGRIRDLLSARDDEFTSQLSDLANAMQKTAGTRDEILSRLSDEHVKLALTIAKPWYLGYVGTPSNFVLKDDAAFATFLEAQSYQKIVDVVPRPTYPSGSAGSWDVAPKGATAPVMPEQVKDWAFHPGGPSAIVAPDPAWKVYATTKHASVEEARMKKPTATKP